MYHRARFDTPSGRLRQLPGVPSRGRRRSTKKIHGTNQKFAEFPCVGAYMAVVSKTLRRARFATTFCCPTRYFRQPPSTPFWYKKDAQPGTNGVENFARWWYRLVQVVDEGTPMTVQPFVPVAIQIYVSNGTEEKQFSCTFKSSLAYAKVMEQYGQYGHEYAQWAASFCIRTKL